VFECEAERKRNGIGASGEAGDAIVSMPKSGPGHEQPNWLGPLHVSFALQTSRARCWSASLDLCQNSRCITRLST